MYNEGARAAEVIRRFPGDLVEEIVVVNDASTDGSEKSLLGQGITLLSLQKRSGPGTAIRKGIDYGLEKKFDAFLVFATNGKDNPEEIPRLLDPLLDNRADFVQGSRYLSAGGGENMPWHRVWGVRAFTFLFSIFTQKRITDATNGFRAFRKELVADKGIDLWQDWLNGYPLETYLFVQAIRRGYRVMEVPVTKTYPKEKKNYTKMRPFLDWWHYFKPVIYVSFGIRK